HSALAPCSAPSLCHVLLLALRLPPVSPLFPYPPLFRSTARCCIAASDSPPGTTAALGWACTTRHSGSLARSSSLRPVHSPYPTSDRKSTRLNSSHVKISYAVLCSKKRTRRAWSPTPSYP